MASSSEARQQILLTMICNGEVFLAEEEEMKKIQKKEEQKWLQNYDQTVLFSP